MGNAIKKKKGGGTPYYGVKARHRNQQKTCPNCGTRSQTHNEEACGKMKAARLREKTTKTGRRRK